MLTNPTVETLFDTLARRRRKLTFAAALTLEQRLAALSWDAPATGVTMRLDRIPMPPPKSGQVATDLDPAAQERALYNLRLKARTALNEQGINILFVALGFLEWFSPDAPEQIWRSPLLLLPVELQRAPLGVEYSLRPLDDEIALNPTLAHKLRHDLGWRCRNCRRRSTSYRSSRSSPRSARWSPRARAGGSRLRRRWAVLISEAADVPRPRPCRCRRGTQSIGAGRRRGIENWK